MQMSPHGRPADGERTVVVAHPGAELFGSDRMVLESVRALVAGGFRVVVALPEQGPLVPHLIATGAHVVIVPMLVLRKALLRPRSWPQLWGNAVRGARAAWRLIRRQRPVAVYVSTVTIPQWTLVARMLGVPSVTHVHEAEGSASRPVKAALYGPHVFAQCVLVNSEFSRQTIGGVFPGLAARADVVYNGVEAPTSPPAPRREVDTVRLLYMGRLSPRKGVADVIEAARVLHDGGMPVAVSILGSVFPGYEWFETELRAAADQTGAPEITFLGFQPDVWSVVAANDILLVPSRVDEPFGNTAVEGILARRPVIATDTSGLREAAGDYTTALLVPPSDPVALATAVTDVVDGWATMRTSVNESAERALRRHSTQSYRDRILAALESML